MSSKGASSSGDSSSSGGGCSCGCGGARSHTLAAMSKSLEQMLEESARAAAQATRSVAEVPVPQVEDGRVYFEARHATDASACSRPSR